jgi:hypothetical protein
VKEKLHASYCKQWVYSGERWDIKGHQCGNKPFKDGLCKRHQPGVIEAQRQKTLSKSERKWNARMREAINAAHAPKLADALRDMLTHSAHTVDRHIAHERTLKAYEDAIEEYED